LAKRVSVIATVKNEAGSIGHLLDSLLAQTRQPDEIVIVDGGSTDGTVEVIRSYIEGKGIPIKLIVRQGCNISQGRNTAIRAAAGEIIASTDAGVRLSPNWLEELVKPFEEGGQCPDVVSGFFLPEPQTVFETAMGATVLPTLEEIDLQRRFRRFFPSSRSIAFRKEAWQRVGGYPEWLDYCEDLVFDLRLKDEGFRFAFAPEAVAHFRPRPNLAAFFRQYYRYARGDGKADLWRLRHIIRYSTYLMLIPILFLLGLWHNPLWWFLLILAAAFTLWTPYKRLLPMIADYDLIAKLKAIAWVPIIRVTGDVAKMVGYPVGVWWRLRKLDRGSQG